MYNYRRVNKKKSGKFKIALIVTAIVIGIELIIQIVWPSTILTPNTKIDGENFGLWDKSKVASLLDSEYSNVPVDVVFGDNTESYITSTMDEVGLLASNARRINQINYPVPWRLVPTSIFWYGLLAQVDQPSTTIDDISINLFITNNFDDNNYIEPVNAGLVMTDQSIDLRKSQVGGNFSLSELKNALANPSYENHRAIIRVDITPEYPKVDDEQALKVATAVSGQLIDSISLTFDDYTEEVILPVEMLRSWISFSIVDDKLIPIINERKLNSFLSDEVAPLIEKAAGTTTITTSDLAGLERNEGDEGKVLNTTETAWRLTEYLLGKRQSVAVAVESVDPTVEYVYERISHDDDQIETDSLLNLDELEELLDSESSI